MTNEIALTIAGYSQSLLNGIRELLSLPVVTALAGVVIAQLLQMKSKKMELEHQNDTDTKKLKRECLEKMFVGLREIDKNRRLVFRTYTEVYKNECNKNHADQFINDESSTNDDFFIYGEIYFTELFEKCFKDINILGADIESKTRYCSNFNQDNFRTLLETMKKWDVAIHNSKLLIRDEIKKL